jgi:hypothetical protein
MPASHPLANQYVAIMEPGDRVGEDLVGVYPDEDAARAAVRDYPHQRVDIYRLVAVR